MYRVLCDGLPIYDLRDENLVLIDPKLDLEVNKAGAFSFKMPPQHPQYELPQKMLSCIQVFQDEEEVFNGRITECKIDFYNRKHFTCEGQLAYLNDSIQRPAEYHDMTVRGYLESLITSHNEQVKKDRQFKVGIVTVTDNNDSLYRYTNYNSTMKEIKEDLVDDLGGYLRVRNVNGTASFIVRYISTCNQLIISLSKCKFITLIFIFIDHLIYQVNQIKAFTSEIDFFILNFWHYTLTPSISAKRFALMKYTHLLSDV